LPTVQRLPGSTCRGPAAAVILALAQRDHERVGGDVAGHVSPPDL
jgi:hypothetical protein